MSDAKPRWLPQALTAREVATVLGVNINTVKRIPPERLPFDRVSTRGDRRYRLVDVDAYLAGIAAHFDKGEVADSPIAAYDYETEGLGGT